RRSSCGTRKDDFPTRPWFFRRERRPDNWSAREGTQSISQVAISARHIVFNISILSLLFVAILAALKVPRETLAKLQARPQQPRFHRRHTQLECGRSLFRGQTFHVPQHEHRPKTRGQALEGLA